MDQARIGGFIQQSRKAKGLTQKELADAIGVSDKTVSKWETAHGLPDIASLAPLCRALEINVNELLSGEKLPPNEYNEKAEENMMKLLKENETSARGRTARTVAGCVTAAAALLLTACLSRSSGLNVLWYFDISAVLTLLLIAASCVLLSGAKGWPEAIRVLQRAVIPAGCFEALLQLIIVLSDLSDPAVLGPNIAVVILTPLYALLVYLILIPVRHRLGPVSG